MHLLGPSWQNLPLVPSAATPTSSPAQEGHPTGSQTAHQSAEIAFHPLERSALTSAFRLMCGTCPRLRRASADALLAHSRRYDARGGDHGNGAGDLGMALSTTLLGSVHAAVALVRGASIVVQELLQRQRHSSGDQVRAVETGVCLDLQSLHIHPDTHTQGMSSVMLNPAVHTLRKGSRCVQLHTLFLKSSDCLCFASACKNRL